MNCCSKAINFVTDFAASFVADSYEIRSTHTVTSYFVHEKTGPEADQAWAELRQSSEISRPVGAENAKQILSSCTFRESHFKSTADIFFNGRKINALPELSAYHTIGMGDKHFTYPDNFHVLWSHPFSKRLYDSPYEMRLFRADPARFRPAKQMTKDDLALGESPAPPLPSENAEGEPAGVYVFKQASERRKCYLVSKGKLFGSLLMLTAVAVAAVANRNLLVHVAVKAKDLLRFK